MAEGFQWGLMGSSSNLESGADGDVNCGNPGPEFSEVKTISKWA